MKDARHEPRPSDEGAALPPDLQRWLGAGLISSEQAARISAFEVERARAGRIGGATRAIALLGALTLVSGVGSLVAYNWAKLGDGMKLLGLGLLLLAGTLACVRAMRQKRGDLSVALDASIVVTAGLTVAGLGLVSQIYHQDGELYQLLFWWCALVSPLFLFARTRFAHFFWFGALFVSAITSVEEFDRFLQARAHYNSDERFFLGLFFYGTVSGLIAQGFARSIYAGRRSAGLALFHLLLVGVGLFGGLLWLFDDSASASVLLSGLLAGALLTAAVPKSADSLGFGTQNHVRVLLGLGALLAVLPAALPFGSSVAAFFAFVAFWVLAWFLAEKAGNTKNARLSVGVLGIRIIIASFELFESLLLTGCLLVAMGAGALFWSRLKWSQAVDGGAAHD